MANVRIRREINNLVTHRENPTTITVGAVASPGTSPKAAPIDHVHGVDVDLGEQLSDSIVLFQDFFGYGFTPDGFGNFGLGTPDQPTETFDGETITVGIDNPGNTGASGTLFSASDAAVTTLTGGLSDGSSGFCAIFTSDHSTSTFGQFKAHSILFQRIETMAWRFEPTRRQSQLVNCHIVLGAVRISGAADVGSGFTFTPYLGLIILDGVYFRLDTDINGAGTWHAICTVDSVSTDVNTGISAQINGNDVVFANNTVGFQTFTITFDGTAVRFFIRSIDQNNVLRHAGENPVATITTNIPDQNHKLGIMGAVLQNRTAIERTIAMDNFLLISRRELPVPS